MRNIKLYKKQAILLLYTMYYACTLSKHLGLTMKNNSMKSDDRYRLDFRDKMTDRLEVFKELIQDLESKNDRIALLWTLTNSKKINRRQFKELLNTI